jgi:hypothetical protein
MGVDASVPDVTPPVLELLELLERFDAPGAAASSLLPHAAATIRTATTICRIGCYVTRVAGPARRPRER